MNNPKNIPQHVAIIMDGNGRWAASRSLPKIAGHRAGVKAVQGAIKTAMELGVKVLTLYTFSTENWKRPRREIDALFRLLENYLDKEEKNLKKNNIRLMTIGNSSGLPGVTQEKLKRTIESTKNNTGLILNVALNYGARTEIVEAARKVAVLVKEDKVRLEEIDEKLFSDCLYTKSLPDPDLLIRTSGESRLSNFLLWQISYTEIYITKRLWPDFKKRDFEKAILEYQKRKRRFGG